MESGEECDDGPLNSNRPQANCKPNCTRNLCGNGRIDNLELCDDGGRANGDGCNEFCRIENVRPAAVETQVAGVTNQQNVQFPQGQVPITQVAGVTNQQNVQFPQGQVPQSIGTLASVFGAQTVGFPQSQYAAQQQLPTIANLQPLPYGLPFTSSVAQVRSQAPIGDTGPAAVLAIALGSAAGFGFSRKKKRN